VPFTVAAATILREQGLAGMYRGFVPNALKNLPNKGARCLGWRLPSCHAQLGCCCRGASRPPSPVQEATSPSATRLKLASVHACVCTPARPLDPASPTPFPSQLTAGVKLSVFDAAKTALANAEKAYAEECEKEAAEQRLVPVAR
jgi:hypothetical protein